MEKNIRPRYREHGKRLFDLGAAMAVLAVAAVPMLVIAFCIKLDSAGPVFFCQKRMGRDLKPFICYKFRTMRVDAPSECAASMLRDRGRYVTRMGRFLRRTSLDELPQFFNVLKGDMSLIGPRPLILSEKDVIRKRAELGIYALRPGISGLAQISGRNFISDSEKILFDLRYLQEGSLTMDMVLALKTVLYVAAQKDIR